MLKVQSEPLEGNGCDELFSGTLLLFASYACDPFAGLCFSIDYDGVLELINKTHSRASVFVESLSLDIVSALRYM